MAGLPGICDVNVLVSHTIGDDISPSAWSRGTLIPKNRPKVHLPAHSVPRLQRDPPPAARTVAQHAKRTGSLMTDASHRVSKPTPQSVAQSRPPFSHTGRLPSAGMHPPNLRLLIQKPTNLRISIIFVCNMRAHMTWGASGGGRSTILRPSARKY